MFSSNMFSRFSSFFSRGTKQDPGAETVKMKDKSLQTGRVPRNQTPEEHPNKWVLFETVELKMKRRNIKRSFYTFCENTTLHGFQYLIKVKLGLVRRLVWSIIITTIICIGIWLLCILTYAYLNYHVKLQVVSQTVPLKNVSFPAIIICNVNPLLKSTMYNLTKIFVTDGNETLQEKVWSLAEEEFIFGRERNLTDLDNDLLYEFLKQDSYVEEFNEYIRVEESIHSRSRFKSYSKEESIIYSKTPLDEAHADFINDITRHPNQAISYNMRRAAFPYVSRQYRVNELVFHIKSKNENTVKNESCFGTDFGICDRVLVEGPVRSGEELGLTIYIDTEIDNYGTWYRRGEGILLAIGGSHYNVPLMYQDGIGVSPGYEYHVGVSTTITNFDPDIERFNPKERNCYFEKEIEFHHLPQKFGYEYSMTNCLIEAAIQQIDEKCHCEANFLGISATSCQGHNLSCQHDQLKRLASEHMQNLVDEGTEKVQPCLSACKSQTHEVTLSHSAYPNEHLIPQLDDFCYVLEKIISKSCKSSKRKVMDEHFEEFVISCRFCDFMDNLTARIDFREYCPADNNLVDFDVLDAIITKEKRKELEKIVVMYMKRNIIKLNFFVNEPFAKEVVITEIQDVYQYFSQIGGLMGLLMGMSFVSAIEVCYHCTMTCCGLYERRRERLRHHHYRRARCGDTPPEIKSKKSWREWLLGHEVDPTTDPFMPTHSHQPSQLSVVSTQTHDTKKGPTRTLQPSRPTVVSTRTHDTKKRQKIKVLVKPSKKDKKKPASPVVHIVRP